MIFDSELLFSEDQAITSTASSTNVVDLGAPGTPVGGNQLSRDIGKGKMVPLLIQVTEDFATLTSLEFQIRTASALSGGALDSPTTLLAMSEVVANLVAGYKTPVLFLPRGVERYLDINYAVTGSNATAGTVTAGVVMGVQDGFPD